MFPAFQEQQGEEQEPAPAFMSGSANPLARVLVLRRIEVLTQAVVLLLAVAWLKIGASRRAP